MNQKVALVTGGNKGLGLETCRQLGAQGFQILLTSRDPAKGKPRVEELRKQGINATYYPLDVASSKSIEELFHSILKEIGHLDVLVNNAAIFIDADQSKPRDVILRETLETNVVGAYHLCELFAPVMYRQKWGRIVNVSSGAGQLCEMSGEYEAYAISKTALNAVTCVFAAKMKGVDVLVNSICPGWVKTDMGGESAPRSLEEGGKSIVWGALLPTGGPSGGFFRDGQPLDW
ncbi:MULTISPECIES: SDR family oxidoreductase [Parachlamydia]|uniref:SDR family oxidoreductase n=1 Tax=Parachlamydia TaxID=83551 RepID=UPI00075107F1|nr:SDR family oxidoreductase [Parachlamydia acanthamoebae]